MKKDLNRYLTEVGTYLICSKRQKKIILENLQTSIRDYVEYENVQDISAVYNHFGIKTTVCGKVYVLKENAVKHFAYIVKLIACIN